MSDADRAKDLFFEGLAHCDAGDYAAAEPCFRAALAIVPGRVSVLTNLATVLLRQRKFEEAADVADQAIAADDTAEDAFLAATSAHYELGRTERALALFPRLAAIAPENPAVWLGLGSTLELAGRFDEAAATYDRLIALEAARGHLFRALLRLRLGDFASGWAEHEWRLRLPDHPTAGAANGVPLWTGYDPTGRRILLTIEQGHGDVLQFLRYAPLVAARGAAVTLMVPPTLRGLIADSFPGMTIVDRADPALSYDAHAALMSLPAIFGHRSEDAIPRTVPYLTAAPEMVEKWRARLGSEGLRVGIAWQGNPVFPTDRTRSIPLAAFAPLAGVPGVRLISLQARQGLDQLNDLPAAMAVERLGPELEDNPDGFRELAAVMESLDLIVTSDTAPAHLAGALGRPVWVALRTSADWRWLEDRADSPWYPTMRLFRQRASGDWPGVFGEIATALGKFAGA